MSLKAMLDLTGRTALVTGGGRGLGLEMAEGLAEMGAKIAISGRSSEELESAREQLERLGAEVFVVVNDLSKAEGPSTLAETVIKHYGCIDVLVNNAGRGWAEPAEEMSSEMWRKLMRLNVDAVYELSTAVARLSMIPQQYGRIINIASGLGLRTRMPNPKRPPMAAYATSKAALVHMTRALAAEWGRYGITVNAIAPGPFPSKMNSTLQEVETDFIARTPTGRLGRHGDLMGTAVLLASNAAAHTTGQIIAIDGGMTLVM